MRAWQVSWLAHGHARTHGRPRQRDSEETPVKFADKSSSRRAESQ